MKKKLPIILLGVILACVLVFGFLYANNDIGKTHDHGASTPSHIRIQLKMDRCETTLLDGYP